MKLEELTSYEIIEKRRIADLDSESCLLRHKKTGARVALLSNKDENKVFCIGFRTTPVNSTGVAHITEHSVLCGSERFPVKDPFVELVKGSLNTFLNAITYPDKTIYPVASCNDKDFQNLMEVYLDAVFYPNIYKEEKIFRQEGWHYELQEAEGELTLNGVVYNEMKGAFSSPDEVLEREVMNSLYPDTTYGFESGGDPQQIPQLSYGEFLDFHRKYYHPSNSYIYLYGNMDMAEKLDYIDREYLSAFDAQHVESEVELQKPFAELHRVEKEYPIGEDEKEEENTYLAYSMSIADTLDRELYLAFQILDYALCSAQGAPLKKALTDAGIGTDISSHYENGIRQPYFSIVAKNADADEEQAFLDTVTGVLRELVSRGIDSKSLLAGLSYYEFKYREADFGSYPAGLMYLLQMYDSWLYDDTKPFIHIEANETFAALREKVGTGYYEELVQKYLLDNPHKSLVVLKPVRGLTEKRDRELRAALQERRLSMTEEERARLVAETAALKAYQDAPDSEEALKKLPMLSVEDVKKEAAPYVNELRRIGDRDFLFHELFTNGICYLRLIFKLDQIPDRLFPYVGILKGLLGFLNTEKHAYTELYHDMHILTGGMAAVSNVYENVKQEKHCTVTLELKTKVLEKNLGEAVELMREILLTSDFSDRGRLKEILAEGKSRMQAQMNSAGHMVAAGRALAGVSESAALGEQLTGIEFYRLVEDLDNHFEEKAQILIENLTELSHMVFRAENLMFDLTGSKGAADVLPGLADGLVKGLYTDEVEKSPAKPELLKRREGFKTPGQIQYVCRAGNFKDKGLAYTGSLRVLTVLMGYDYLWNQVRVQGGAYGCMCSFSRFGDCYFVSYRDPKLKETLEVYQKAADYMAAYEADERTLTQYIIGAVGELDVPMTAATKGLYSLSGFMTGMTDADRQRERDELLATNGETLRNMADYIRAFMADGCLCVVGNAEKLEENKALFDSLENLVNG